MSTGISGMANHIPPAAASSSSVGRKQRYANRAAVCSCVFLPIQPLRVLTTCKFHFFNPVLLECLIHRRCLLLPADTQSLLTLDHANQIPVKEVCCSRLFPIEAERPVVEEGFCQQARHIVGFLE